MDGADVFPELLVHDQVTGDVLGTMRDLVARYRKQNEVVIAGRTFRFGTYQGFAVTQTADDGLAISVTFAVEANAELQSAVLALHTLALEGKMLALNIQRRAQSDARAGVQSE